MLNNELKIGKYYKFTHNETFWISKVDGIIKHRYRDEYIFIKTTGFYDSLRDYVYVDSKFEGVEFGVLTNCEEMIIDDVIYFLPNNHPDKIKFLRKNRINLLLKI